MRTSVVLALSILATGTAAGQGGGSGERPDERAARILAAAQLPVSANAARNEGAPAAEVRTVVDAMRNKNVPASEARTVLDEARNARREHGPVDNFGAFVQSKLDAGLRGRDLAAAIRAEHAARGKGKSGAAKASDRAKGKSAAASDTKGKSPAARDAKGKSGAGGPGGGKRPPASNNN